ncbi:heterokaryon incompatibility protein-domain-containing protein [Paraphoma chrysanthemicola]|nr:heterokaryon incompatibility protein-domain-containing protein [Paraphoma chrysanthemicola]
MSYFPYDQYPIDSASQIGLLEWSIDGTGESHWSFAHPVKVASDIIGDDSVDFAAVSYEWGESEELHSIKIDGHDCRVRPNLMLFLEALPSLKAKQKDLPRKFWIDSICIDQEKSSEKNAQINLLNDIYSSANCVISWLGPEEDYSNLAMQYLSGIRTAGDAVDALLNRRYWTRLWMVQEVVLGNAWWIACGSHIVNGEYLTDLMHNIEPGNVRTDRYICQWRQSRAYSLTRERVSYRQHGPSTFAQLLIRFYKLESKFRVDKVRALLALTSEINSIQRLLRLLEHFTEDPEKFDNPRSHFKNLVCNEIVKLARNKFLCSTRSIEDQAEEEKSQRLAPSILPANKQTALDSLVAVNLPPLREYETKAWLNRYQDFVFRIFLGKGYGLVHFPTQYAAEQLQCSIPQIPESFKSSPDSVKLQYRTKYDTRVDPPAVIWDLKGDHVGENLASRGFGIWLHNSSAREHHVADTEEWYGKTTYLDSEPQSSTERALLWRKSHLNLSTAENGQRHIEVTNTAPLPPSTAPNRARNTSPFLPSTLDPSKSRQFQSSMKTRPRANVSALEVLGSRIPQHQPARLVACMDYGGSVEYPHSGTSLLVHESMLPSHPRFAQYLLPHRRTRSTMPNPFTSHTKVERRANKKVEDRAMLPLQ